jgi:hypothetical protein
VDDTGGALAGRCIDSSADMGTFFCNVVVWTSGPVAPFEQVALEGHTANVTSCEWNPDGTRLATASSAITKTVGGGAAQCTLPAYARCQRETRQRV